MDKNIYEADRKIGNENYNSNIYEFPQGIL
jgi:hypothetical protein